MEQPLVSIVTPAFQSARFLTETIESVLQQDYQPIEHIIIDGGSNDGTLQILNRYPHLRWISEPDRGQSHALNKGFNMANGQIIGWINADDTYNLDAVSTSVSSLLNNSLAGLVYSDMQIIDQNNVPIRVNRARQFSLEDLLSINYINQATVFFKRILLESTGGVNENLNYCMDREFWFRLGTKFQFLYQQGFIAANFRVHPNAKSSGELSKFHAEWLGVMVDAQTNPLYSEISNSRIKRAIMQTRTRMHLSQINESLRKHNYKKTGYFLIKLMMNDWKYMSLYTLDKIF
jgi:glycosyltransferase involved in cell wall biosynthesis